MRKPVIGLVIMLSACAQTPPPPPPATSPAPIAALAPTWRPHMAWTASQKGGAAIRGGGYEHVVAVEPRDPSAALNAITDPKLGQVDFDRMIDSVIASGKSSDGGPAAVNALANLTPAQRAAWAKYCEGGLGMTKADWTIIAATSGPPFNILPAVRAAGCSSPRQDQSRQAIAPAPASTVAPAATDPNANQATPSPVDLIGDHSAELG